MFKRNHSAVNRIPVEDVRKAGEYVVSRLPNFWQEFRSPQLNRTCEEISWIYVDCGTVVDIGGGSGFHASICACLGMEAFCVDNFKTRDRGHVDDHFYEHDLIAEKVATELGVEFIHTDILEWIPEFEKNSIDVVMSFDNIEHLHHSPRKFYKRMVECLKFEGLFLIGAPNATNLLKRIRVPFGKNIFAPIEEWYLHERFIGHVREPTFSDLRFIAEDLDLNILSLFGRNWLGLKKLSKEMQVYGKIIDRLIRLFPTFCSDIYVLAEKI